MDSILFWLGALVVVSLLQPVLKLVIAAVAGKEIGARALAQQPDRITLRRGDVTSWKKADQPRKFAAALGTRGFQDAGVYTVAEMPGLVVQLLAHGSDGALAAIYEHPQAGHWFDIVSKFADGTSITYTSAAPSGLKDRPGHPVVNMRGAEPLAVLDKALAMRPRRPLAEVSAHGVVGIFEQAYADSMTYRKQVGISSGEVMKSAMRKAA